MMILENVSPLISLAFEIEYLLDGTNQLHLRKEETSFLLVALFSFVLKAFYTSLDFLILFCS
jgi:hypothetical protein